MGFTRNPEAMWREEDHLMDDVVKGLTEGLDVAGVGTSVILMPNGTMYSLNLLGTWIWKLCDGRSMENMVTSLQEVFEVEAEELREDIEAFIDEMKEAGLINEE